MFATLVFFYLPRLCRQFNGRNKLRDHRGKGGA